jgi:hypothetical protein
MEKQELASVTIARFSRNKGAGALDPEVGPLGNKMTLFELPHDQRGCYV